MPLLPAWEAVAWETNTGAATHQYYVMAGEDFPDPNYNWVMSQQSGGRYYVGEYDEYNYVPVAATVSPFVGVVSPTRSVYRAVPSEQAGADTSSSGSCSDVVKDKLPDYQPFTPSGRGRTSSKERPPAFQREDAPWNWSSTTSDKEQPKNDLSR